MEDAERNEMGSTVNEVTELRKICAVCENALLKILDPESYTQTREPSISHHEDLSSLATSFESGCWICAAITDRVRQDQRPDRAVLRTSLSPHLEQVQPVGWGNRSISRVRIHFSHESEPLSFENVILTVYFEQDERGSLDIISGRQITEIANLAMARDWINECACTHELCASIEEKPLPTRVIDLGPGGVLEPKLLETGNRLGVFTALSHCWGDTARRDQLTTTQNMAARLDSLPFKNLAQTFQDAVIATRSLGYRYLWIDCFCIIQDDDEDSARQCGLMANVFANAAVVLAASCASSPDVGFLHARSRRTPSDTIRGSSKTFPPGNVQVGPHILGVEMQTDIESIDGPPWARIGYDALSRRAWAYQERVLCTRILGFHQEQLVFECRYGRRYERRPTYVDDSSPRRIIDEALLPLVKDSILSKWPKAVENVTSRFITYGNDVLPALAGVASRYQSLTGHTFAAGLWQETLLKDMTWTTRQLGSSNATYASTSWSPSWSWTSCPGSVYFLRPYNSAKSEAAAEVLEVLAQPENDSNPYGAVSKAQLTLRGPMKRTRCYWEAVDLFTFDFFVEDDDGVYRQVMSDFYPDSCEPSTRSPEAAIDVAIFLLWTEVAKQGCALGTALLLRALSRTQPVYRRIGLLSGVGPGPRASVTLDDLIKDAEQSTVCIV